MGPCVYCGFPSVEEACEECVEFFATHELVIVGQGEVVALIQQDKLYEEQKGGLYVS